MMKQRALEARQEHQGQELEVPVEAAAVVGEGPEKMANPLLPFVERGEAGSGDAQQRILTRKGGIYYSESAGESSTNLFMQ